MMHQLDSLDNSLPAFNQKQIGLDIIGSVEFLETRQEALKTRPLFIPNNLNSPSKEQNDESLIGLQQDLKLYEKANNEQKSGGEKLASNQELIDDLQRQIEEIMNEND